MITGTEAWAAISTSVAWANTRAAITSTHRDRLRATSGTDSRLPRPTSGAERYTAAPPSWIMPTSNVTRVRSDGFSNTSAMVRPVRGVMGFRAFCFALSSAVSANRVGGRPSRPRSLIERKCFCFTRRRAPSDFSTISAARSSEGSSTTSGGARRSVLSPAVSTRRPRSRHAATASPTGGHEVDPGEETLAPHLLHRGLVPRLDREQSVLERLAHARRPLGQPLLEHRGEHGEPHRGGERDCRRTWCRGCPA